MIDTGTSTPRFSELSFYARAMPVSNLFPQVSQCPLQPAVISFHKTHPLQPLLEWIQSTHISAIIGPLPDQPSIRLDEWLSRGYQ
jgi:hypothetical protein